MSGGLYIGGDTSGSVLLYPTPVAGSTTITIAAQSGTLNVAGPAVYVTATGTQTPTGSVWTKTQLNTETFDTANCFDSSTNYRFTPNVAGYYFATANYDTGPTSGATGAQVQIYKNGTAYGTAAGVTNVQNYQYYGWVNALVYCNGTTDYIEVYTWTTGATPRINGVVFYAYFVRGA